MFCSGYVGVKGCYKVMTCILHVFKDLVVTCVLLTLTTDVTYSWLSVSFSPGGFKTVPTKTPTQARVQTTTTDNRQSTWDSPPSCVYSCPQEGCIKVFQRASGLERHLSLEACFLSPERHTLMELAKQQYATGLQDGVGLIPLLQVRSSVGTSNQDQNVKEGCALQVAKKPYRFNQKQRIYLEAKFNIGQSTGSKVDLAFVAKEMRRSQGTDGEWLFCVSEFLTTQQVSSFFSWLALKVRQQQVEVSPEDVLAAEEQNNFAMAKENVLSSLLIHHPIVVDQYDVCSLVNNKSEFRKTKLGLLQHICECLELNVPVPALRRKARYITLLEELVNSCPCNDGK